MANTYTWIIEQMDCYPVNPQPDCVFSVHWRCNGTDSATPVNEATIFGIQEIAYNPSDPYIPYNSLTEAIVIGWVQSAMGVSGVADVEANLSTQLVALENPQVVSPPLPWN